MLEQRVVGGPERRRRRRQVHHRLRQRRRRRQRLARVVDLLRQGPGGRRPARSTTVTVINHDTDAAGQLTDIRDLIATNVDAIVINPNDPDALNPAIDEAIAAGIPVVAIDASVTAPGAYNLSNDQVEYAYLGAKSLFEQMGKKGAVVYMRGIAGHPADTDRDTGFKKALAEYPDIKVAKEVVTKWDPATAVSQINDIMTSGVPFDGDLDLRRGLVDRRRHEDRQPSARADRRRGQRGLRHAAPRRAGPHRARP